MENSSSRMDIPGVFIQRVKQALFGGVWLLFVFSSGRLRAQYLDLTPCAYAMVSGLDSLTGNLGADTSCTANVIQRRTILPSSCAMVGCNPSVPTPRILYYLKVTYGPAFYMYWHVRGAGEAWGTYGFCDIDTSTIVFPGGPGCSANHLDRIELRKIVGGVLVNDSVPNILSIKNPRLMTPASPFWSLISSAELMDQYSPMGILVDVTTVNGSSYTATLKENYNNYIKWKQSLPCPTITSFAHSTLVNPSYGCSKYNFEASISGYSISCPASILNASWNFGDGTPLIPNCTDTTGISVIHQYGLAGTYSVTLTLTMAGTGTCVLTGTDTVNVSCTPPPCDDCISSFAPIPGKKYLVSAWTKEKNAAQSKTSYTYPSVTVLFPSISGSAGPFVASGDIIDGWQRIEGEFTIPPSATDMTVKLDCSSSDCYYDDVRVLPFDGSMKSYVYDPVTTRLMGELDERNYATLYEYDEEGKLIRVKKETEKGKMTIKETRDNTRK